MNNITYKDFIEQIIRERGKNSKLEERCERHHILPKCCGGSDELDNLIDLTLREHYIAHYLLAKENPQNRGLKVALKCMLSIHCDDDVLENCADIYENARKLAYEGICEHNKAIATQRAPEERHRIAMCGGLGNKKRLEDPSNNEAWRKKCIEIHANRSRDEKEKMYKKSSESLKEYYSTHTDEWAKRVEKNRLTNIKVSKMWRSEFQNIFGQTPESFRKYGKMKSSIDLYKNIKNLDKSEQAKAVEEFKTAIYKEEIV